MNRKLMLGFVFAFSVLAISKNASADRRSYVWTYEYQTMPKGQAEVEYYTTLEVPKWENTDTNTWKHWLELEYGITDRWDVSLYQQFKQTNKKTGSDFEYDGFKARTRYRIGERGLYLVDPLLYLEYIRNDNLNKPNLLEGKLILARDFDRLNVAYNQIIKQELDSDGATEHEYAAAASYELMPAFKFGLESKGSYTSEKYYLGPVASWATEKFWITVSPVFGLNNRSDDIQVRSIVGIPF